MLTFDIFSNEELKRIPSSMLLYRARCDDGIGCFLVSSCNREELEKRIPTKEERKRGAWADITLNANVSDYRKRYGNAFVYTIRYAS